ncbi:MAG TPA: EAL domain-containing protein [Thermoanaerobaculia bacterium]|jgi:diguanylate cyclase (GGDEF)-like protein/PAS domain S-box-containing protein
MTIPSHAPVPADTRPSRFERARNALVRLLRRGSSRERLRTQLAILRAQQEATLEGILVVDPAGNVLSYNRRFLEIWRIPEGAAASADDNALLGFAAEAVKDWDAFIELVNYLYEHPDEVRKDDHVPLRDGRTLSRATVPIVVGGEIRGRSWYFRDITESVKSERLQAALFRIAELTRDSENLDAFYAAVHGVVGELLNAQNFYIAEYDESRDRLTFPYFVDEYDESIEHMNPGRGLTAYVLRTGKPLLATPEVFDRLVATGEVEPVGAPSVDWLGAPLTTGDKTWGVIVTQTYRESSRFSETEQEVLVFVARHIASAIEQKRKDDALRENERRYRQMFENNRAVKLLIDPNDGEIVDANMAACDYYGYTRDELRAMRIWQINVRGEDGVRDEMQRAAQQERAYFHFRHMRANGEVRDVEVHSGPIELGGRRLLYSIVHDITERKRAEEALQKSEEKYRVIFDYAPVGIYQSTRDGRLLTANATLARMLGYESVEELLTKNLERDVYFDAQQREELIRRFEPFGYANNVELRWRRRDGTPIWVQLNAHSIRNSGRSPIFEGFVYDVSERKRAEESVAAANMQRKAVLDAATRVSIIATDSSGVITVFNAGAERMLGYASEEMVGRPLLELHAAGEVPALEDGGEHEWTYMRRNGDRVTVAVSVTALRIDDVVTGYLYVGTDMTALRKQSAAIAASMDGIGILNERLEFTYLNDSLAKLFGYPDPETLLGKSLCDLYEPHEQVRFITSIVPLVQQRGRWRGEATGLRRDAVNFPQEISLTSIAGGGMVCVVRDITERTYAEEQIKHLAYHDALTDMPNRLLFKDRVTVALSHAQREQSRLAVLFLDLDRFKVINDSLGHNIGDSLLQAVSARLQACVRESDTVARLGGDEFTVLLPRLHRADDAVPVASKIIEAIRHPFHIEGREFFITTSIGISLFPEDGTDAETLIKNADTAMYQAKELGRDNYQLFNAHVNAKALQRIALEHGLRKALTSDEFAVHYQPIHDFRSGRITGVEALLRWKHPQLGNVPPATFIPLAEATGVMIPIGMWALREAVRQAKAWHDAGHSSLTLAVNLSVTQLQQFDLVERVQAVLTETGLRPELLELEITESSAMQSPEASARTLYDLKKLGIRVSLDDFGTGHSSLSYLKRFPIDTLKIDQSFVHDITSDPDTAAIVKAIIAMAHSLRLKVIAEGVEYSEQAAFLERHECDQMQGFLLTPPVPPDVLVAMLG